MTEQELRAYADEHGLSMAEAWDDFADAFGWEPEDNPYRCVEAEDPAIVGMRNATH